LLGGGILLIGLLLSSIAGRDRGASIALTEGPAI
jgi:hypothetical protein